PFYWGFFPYLVATPVGVWALAAAIRASSRPTPPRVAGVAALGVLLLVSHVLVFGVALAMSVAYTLAESPGRRALRALVGWLPAGLLLVPWLVLDFERPSRGGWDWSLEPSRLLQLASGVAGDARDGPTGWAVLGAVAALGLVAGIRLRPRRGNLALAACGLALAALSPAVAFGISHLSWRLAFWFWLGCATLVAPLPSSPRRQIARLATGLALTLSAGWIGGQIRAFDRDARTFDPILAAMAPGKYLHPLLFDFQSAVGPSARHLHGYLHFGGWYYVEKRGLYAGMFRFAPQQLPIVRTAPLFGDRFTEDSSYWSAASFEREPAGAYDYYLLRQLSEKRAEAFLDSHPALEEIRRSGAWYLLRPAAAAR
ncbi:MAG TPA: hypothetical protein VD788_03815, partial [Candidatus Polarisedimenticolaceae bacterium]|nr:hypothetical protein [Candidatus Polarisedimenticolaceae bacterium]